MDINQARTFLEIARCGSFVTAAERLHVTQTAVSARIRSLEELLGGCLFVRNNAGARLTPAGERLVRHATTMIQAWERARRQMALPPGRKDGVSVGSEPSLWHPLLADWLIWMHREFPEIALRADVDNPTSLLTRVQDGSLDFAVVYDPPSRLNLVSELLLEEKLVLITSSPQGELIGDDYIYVDWGPAFAANHQSAFPELSSSPTSISFGPLALTYLLTVGGCGYFRLGTAQPFLADGRLRRVTNAPEFSYSAYAVHSAHDGNEVIDRVRQGLKHVASAQEWSGLPQPIAPPIHRR